MNHSVAKQHDVRPNHILCQSIIRSLNHNYAINDSYIMQDANSRIIRSCVCIYQYPISNDVVNKSVILFHKLKFNSR